MLEAPTKTNHPSLGLLEQAGPQSNTKGAPLETNGPPGAPVWWIPLGLMHLSRKILATSMDGRAFLSSPVMKMSISGGSKFSGQQNVSEVCAVQKISKSKLQRPSYRSNSNTCTEQTFKMHRLFRKGCDRLFVPLSAAQKENKNWSIKYNANVINSQA